MPEQSESTFSRPYQSIGNLGWEPRPVQIAPPRWIPPGPWWPSDPEAFMRGWLRADEDLSRR